uniref:Uncharacterized protein n=1 Tax=Pipistrellus kuhlii TaxID=59472 RepID=A0A7J8B2A2_PIPKU|nr:hypothetical protein mPipKuh1_007837 [Pipistrellus kuhlii]
MSCNSTSMRFCSRDLITVPDFFVVIVPSSSLSKGEKASLNSAICSLFFIFIFFLIFFLLNYYLCTYFNIAPPSNTYPLSPEFCVHWLYLYACIQVLRLISYLPNLLFNQLVSHDASGTAF